MLRAGDAAQPRRQGSAGAGRAPGWPPATAAMPRQCLVMPQRREGGVDAGLAVLPVKAARSGCAT